MIYDQKWLEDRDACKDGYHWWLACGLDTKDIDLSKVTGDFNGYIAWLRSAPVPEYNDQGLKAKETTPDGNILLYEYNDKGLITKSTYPSGNTFLYEYKFYEDKLEVYGDGRLVLTIPYN